MAQNQTPELSGIWLDLYNHVVDSMADPTDSDLRLVERFVRNLSTADAAMADALAEPFVAGSTGQLTEHPGFKVASRCDGNALSLARQLKLTPFVREHATDEESEDEEDDPILRARDDLAARRQARAA